MLIIIMCAPTPLMVIELHMKRGRQHNESYDIFLATSVTKMLDHYKACKQYYNTRYVRMPDLLMDLDIARTEGNYRKLWQNIPIQCFSFWMNGCFSNQLIQSRKISSNFFIGDARNHQPSSALSRYSKNGTISLEEKQVLWLMQSLTVLPMTAIRSTSQVLMLSMTSPCGRCIV